MKGLWKIQQSFYITVVHGAEVSRPILSVVPIRFGCQGNRIFHSSVTWPVCGKIHRNLRSGPESPNSSDVDDELVNPDLADAELDILEGDRFYQHVVRETEKELKRERRGITQRKYFKQPSETNLLTWAAKEQIRFLHNSDPQTWTVAALANSFPTSEYGIKRLLKSRWVLPVDKIEQHDKSVLRNWEKLTSGKQKDKEVAGPIAPLTRKLFKEGRLKQQYATGNPALPMPAVRPVEEVPKKPPVKGGFQEIITSYKELLQARETREEVVTINVPGRRMRGALSEDEATLPDLRTVPKHLKRSKCVTAAMLSSTQHSRNHRYGSTAMFESTEHAADSCYITAGNSLNAEAAGVSSVTSIDGIGSDDGKLNLRPIKYRQDHQIELTVDERVDRPGKLEPYLYDNNFGYQTPLSTDEDIDDALEAVRTADGLIRRGKSYYTKDGEFLYQVI